MDRFWWASWTSNPVTGRDVRGGFDSHALPPIFRKPRLAPGCRICTMPDLVPAVAGKSADRIRKATSLIKLRGERNAWRNRDCRSWSSFWSLCWSFSAPGNCPKSVKDLARGLGISRRQPKKKRKSRLLLKNPKRFPKKSEPARFLKFRNLYAGSFSPNRIHPEFIETLLWKVPGNRSSALCLRIE